MFLLSTEIDRFAILCDQTKAYKILRKNDFVYYFLQKVHFKKSPCSLEIFFHLFFKSCIAFCS